MQHMTEIKVLCDHKQFYAHENVVDGEVYVLFDSELPSEEYKKHFASCDIDPRMEVVSSGYDEDLDREYIILAVVK